jgi:hypothetical protein
MRRYGLSKTVLLILANGVVVFEFVGCRRSPKTPGDLANEFVISLMQSACRRDIDGLVDGLAIYSDKDLRWIQKMHPPADDEVKDTSDDLQRRE